MLLISLILMVLDYLANANSTDFDNQNCLTLPPLISAILRGNVSSVRTLIARGANPDAINGSDGAMQCCRDPIIYDLIQGLRSLSDHF